MNIISSIMTKNPCYTAGKKITVKGLMLHSVGCPQPQASVFIKQFNSASYSRACVHAFIDGNSGDVYQTLPWNHFGWHCGGKANSTHIGVEMCEPSTIKYTTAGWTETSDGRNTKNVVMRTYAAAVELFAYLCKTYNLNPLADGVIISHSEGYKRGVASNHGDVEHIWNKFGLTMNQFRKDVHAKMTGATTITPTSTSSGALYKVQVGAFVSKANAETLKTKLAGYGFNGFVTYVSGLYKVQVGAFSAKANANALLSSLSKKGFNGFITNSAGTSQATSKDAAYQGSIAKKSVTEIAKEVIAGKWGSGVDRKNRLVAAGYNYAIVQAEVNKLLK